MMERVRSFKSFLQSHGPVSTLDEALLDNDGPISERAHSENEEPTLGDEERALLQRRFQDKDWRLDRGAGYYALERVKNNRPCLVQTGRHAGRSRVRVKGISAYRVLEHKLRRDFFNSAVNAPLHTILSALAISYFGMLVFWSLTYYFMHRFDDTCFDGVDGLVAAFLFALETQQTIGYGTRAPGECWATFAAVAVHSLVTVLLDSLILGIAFSRISHPKNRGRTILVSDGAVIARRDGELKFMFRIADIQRRSVANPSVKALLFTWGPGKQGRVTAEGERIPVTVQDMPLTGLDPTLLLPVTLSHTIDERSPLYGQTQKSLEAVCAEIVVLFAATSELGFNFTIRQSYLPSEIHWGYVFVPIIYAAPDGSTAHSVNIARFHDVEPQPGLDLVPPHRLAAKVMSGGDRGALPAPTRATNTLILSETGVVGSRDGKPMLMFRVGDVFPGGQILDVKVTAFLYRWQTHTTPEGEVIPFTVQPIKLSPSKPCLRYPAMCVHVLDSHSPVASWTNAAAKRLDSDAEMLVVAQGVCAHTGLPMLRQRVYPVLAGIRWGSLFQPIIHPPPQGVAFTRARVGGCHINWDAFHATAPAQMDAVQQIQAAQSSQSQPLSRSPSGIWSQAANQTSISIGRDGALAIPPLQGSSGSGSLSAGPIVTTIPAGSGSGTLRPSSTAQSAPAYASPASILASTLIGHTNSHDDDRPMLSAPTTMPPRPPRTSQSGAYAPTTAPGPAPPPTAMPSHPISVAGGAQGGSPTSFEAHSLSGWQNAAASAIQAPATRHEPPTHGVHHHVHWQGDPHAQLSEVGGAAPSAPSIVIPHSELSFTDAVHPSMEMLQGTSSTEDQLNAHKAAPARSGAPNPRLASPERRHTGPNTNSSRARQLAAKQQAAATTGSAASSPATTSTLVPPAAVAASSSQPVPGLSSTLLGISSPTQAQTSVGHGSSSQGTAGGGLNRLSQNIALSSGPVSRADTDTTGSGTNQRRGTDWRQTRSLFTAMEEMARLAAEESAAAQGKPAGQSP